MPRARAAATLILMLLLRYCALRCLFADIAAAATAPFTCYALIRVSPDDACLSMMRRHALLMLRHATPLTRCYVYAYCCRLTPHAASFIDDAAAFLRAR